MDNHNPHYESAIKAGAEMLHRILCDDDWYDHAPPDLRAADNTSHVSDARDVIDAAAPHLGEHIAAAIDNIADGVTGSPTYRHVYIDALQRAANIARHIITQPHPNTGPADNANARVDSDADADADLTVPHS